MHGRFLPAHRYPRRMLVAMPFSAARELSSVPGKIELLVKKRDGTQCRVRVPVGISLMHALRDVANMDVAGTCNGAMMCATCHVKLSAASFRKTEGPSEEEEDVLAKALDVQETSRLACQVKLTPELDGVEVELPPYETDNS
ncbi:adrenodoxin-like protein [Leishmania tarentolae]|uniref:Adrenodoxin-like protein n=1 Tax=Leishmania tarentolae TaxID=5689 RepID=A0A640KNH3_LEITA|nr:adrenodoxin-like protein [Leishmania tarentolae]